MDEETYNELQLQDLRGDAEQNRILLNIRDQSRFFSQANESENEEARPYAGQDPDEVLRTLQTELDQTFPDDGALVHLGQLVEPEDGDSSDEEQDQSQQVGSKENLSKASTQILGAIRQRRGQTETTSSSDTCGLSAELFERLTLTHATTTEFLRQFWQAFLSGDPDRANELASLVESLNRARERIKAVADDAEGERQVEVQKLKQQARDMMASTGKKMKLDLDSVEGGKKVVNQLLGPTINSLGIAVAEYNKALAQETHEANASLAT
jgi:transcription initiation factor TFIIH subunit 1